MDSKIIYNQDGNYTPGREERWSEGIKLILKLLTGENGRDNIKILDVGCGDGAFYKHLKSKVIDYSIDPKRIEYFGLDSNSSFRQKIEEIKGSFIYSDALNLSAAVGDEEFDIVIASDIIEHIDETDRFINQIKTIVKKGGYIYLTTPNLAAWHCRLMLLFGFQPLPTEVSNISSVFGKGRIGKKYYNAGTIHHIRLFTYRALKEFLKYHGLDIVKAVGGGYRRADMMLFRTKLIGLAPLLVLVLENRKNYYDI